MSRRFLLQNVFVGVFAFLIILGGCSLGKYMDPNWLNSATFNNRFVEGINEMMGKIKNAGEIYHKVIPKEVKKEMIIDMEQMVAANDELVMAKEKLKKLKDLKSRNEEQQKKIIEEFDKYLIAVDKYAEVYKNMLLYYDAKEYQKSIAEVEEWDKNLTAAYEEYSKAHNTFVEELEKFRE